MCVFKALLGDYLDRELSSAERRRVESHLGECRGCRAELDELKSLSNMIGGLPQTALPSGFMDRFERRRSGAAPARARRPVSFSFDWKPVAVFAASLMVFIVAFDRLRTFAPLVSSAVSGAAASVPDAGSLTPPAPVLKSASALREIAKGRRARAPGMPLGDEKAAPEPQPSLETASVTNEELQQGLERQKRLMGIRGIVPPERHPIGQFASVGADTERISVPAGPAMVGGSMAGLLAPASVAAGRGAALEPPPPGAASDEVVVRSEDERARLWSARGVALPAPSVDFSSQLLIAIFAAPGSAVEIVQVSVGLDRTVVRYRRVPAAPGAAASSPALRVVPRTSKPVVFETLP